jgi:N-methylhydantoinase A
VAGLASQLGISLNDTAAGIIRVANENMVQALRVISVQRGIDPAGYTLTCFGGAGGLHVCALAEELGMHEALVPSHSGVLSALGMLVAPRGRQLSRTVTGLSDSFDETRIETLFAELEQRGRDSLTREGVPAADIHCQRSLDLRYSGQSYTLNIPWRGLAQLDTDYHHAHRGRYGHDMNMAVEIVNLRVGLRGPQPEIKVQQGNPASSGQRRQTRVVGVHHPVEIWEREQLPLRNAITGPLLISETVSTTYVAPNWLCERDENDNLLLTRLT